jgi:hypothetical protein
MFNLLREKRIFFTYGDNRRLSRENQNLSHALEKENPVLLSQDQLILRQKLLFF